MNGNNVIAIAPYRKKKPRDRKGINQGKKGTVYSRNGKLWVDFRYLGQRVREPAGLEDTRENRRKVRSQLDLITAEIDNDVFQFAERFPHSKKKEFFSRLEGNTVTRDPEEVLFGEYAEKWLEAMQAGMSSGQRRDYEGALKAHILPYFKKVPFSEFNSVQMKKFLAHLKGKKSERTEKPLSAKRIRNIMIPLRSIVNDAFEEHGWTGMPDPFARLKLPRLHRYRVRPFDFREWEKVMEQIPEWYRPYFEFAVRTGLRPSEQVALKWEAIDDEYIHIELSRVRQEEKTELKTAESRRRIRLTDSLGKVLAQQKALTASFDSPYVFLNMNGRPIVQENLKSIWRRAMEKSALPYRRMYETRHTFASWALGLGESPEWVARTLGHVDTSMVYRTYGRYIPNLTKQDGSALERHFAKNR